MLSSTATRAVDAYGGEDRWRSATQVEAEVSASGLAFTVKRRPRLDHAAIEMAVERPQSRLTPVGLDTELTGVFDNGDVRLERPNGETTAQRDNARTFFPYGRRLVRWDDLDTGLLQRHDYAVDIISPLARAANVVIDHATNDQGLVFPSVRKVTPQGPRGVALAGPVLLDLRIHSLTVA